MLLDSISSARSIIIETSVDVLTSPMWEGRHLNARRDRRGVLARRCLAWHGCLGYVRVVCGAFPV